MESTNSVATVRTLILSRPNEGRLGVLKFDELNRATLVTEGTGPAVEDLKKAWQEIAAMPKVSWVKSVTRESGGQKITSIRSEKYSPADAGYFYAVLDTMSRKYGFAVDIAK